MHNPILAALDVSEPERALALAEQLAPVVAGFKVGAELFTAAGPDIVRHLCRLGATVFLDLKFHDIPNTVARAVANATRLGVRMLTVHASGGLEMMQAAEAAARETAAALGFDPPLVLAVTVLTSMDGHSLEQVGQPSHVGRQVERLAQLAVQAGLRGLVCSPLELVSLRQLLPEEVQLVSPGIRGPTDPLNDQKRTLTAREAIEAGANWLVIGRPIYAAPNPRAAAERILESLNPHSAP